MRAVPRLSSYTLAFVLQVRKNHGKTSVRVEEKCQLGAIPFVDQAAVVAATDRNLQHPRFALQVGQVILGQRKYLPSCRTKGFRASAIFESKLSARALMWSAKKKEG
jgi:hypothetical protein